jgi:hypothetical protein
MGLAAVTCHLFAVWTKDFKSSPAAEDDVPEDDVELAGEGSGKASLVDEDPFVFWKIA